MQKISMMIERTQGWLIPKMLRRRTFGLAFVASLLAVFYWGIIASDRYVSEARVIVQKTDFAGGQGIELGGFLGGVGGNNADQMLLRDHLLSVDMFQKLDSKLSLRAHYSDWHRDPLSRMWFEDAPLEAFFAHYLSRVSVVYDDYAGVLIIKAQAYDSKMAHDIVASMVEEGEQHMNAMVHSLAQEQVSFLEKHVGDMSVRAMQARQEVLKFQNRKGMASPQSTAENLVVIINQLEAQLTELKMRRAALLGYLMPESANIMELNQQIAATKKQMEHEKGRLISPKGKKLNNTVEEYQRIQMNAEFLQDIYKTSLVALEKGHIEASRTLKKVTMLQTPTLPQYPLEPRRLYNIIVFILITLLIAGIIHLFAAIIRDHKD